MSFGMVNSRFVRDNGRAAASFQPGLSIASRVRRDAQAAPDHAIKAGSRKRRTSAEPSEKLRFAILSGVASTRCKTPAGLQAPESGGAVAASSKCHVAKYLSLRRN